MRFFESIFFFIFRKAPIYKLNVQDLLVIGGETDRGRGRGDIELKNLEKAH